MTNIKTRAKTIGLLLSSVMLFPACSDMDEYFEEPDWIAGSIYEKLAEDGQYSIFLRGVDKAGFEPILNGKSILTVMAPTDQAMTTYLQQTYGVQSIDDLPQNEVEKLIGFHVLYYAFDKEKLTNFRPVEGDEMTQKERDAADDAGFYYKFRTKSQDAPTQDNDTALVYHYERYMPIFSFRLFQNKFGQNGQKGIDAKTNYDYFFPDTQWHGDGGFQVSNANVTEYTNIAKNGYIYKVDRVVRPLETIYKEMQQAGKYTKFLSFYDQFKDYKKDDELTLNYGNGKDLYTVSFDRNTTSSLPPIASEWPVNDFHQVQTLSRKTFSIFAPTDQALQKFFEEYWEEGGYPSLDSVSPTLIQTILRHCIYDEDKAVYTIASEKVRSIVFPEEIEAGRVHDENGQIIRFDTQSVPQNDRVICSNGVLYGCSELIPPTMFNSVTGPAFQYKKFSTFQAMITNSGMQSTLSADNVNFIMLYPDNTQFYNNGKIEVDSTTNRIVSEESPKGLSSSKVTSYVNAHAVMPIDGNTVLPSSGTKVFATMSPDMKLYWYLKNGRITNSIKHNELLRYAANTTTENDVFTDFHQLNYRNNPNGGWTNGHAYSYDNLLFEGNFDNVLQPYFVSLMMSQRSDVTTDFFAWIQLLNTARLIDAATNKVQLTDASGNLNVLSDEYLMFVPKTSALEKAIIDGRIPGVQVAAGTAVGDADFFAEGKLTITDQQALMDYVKLYFIPMTTAVVSNYPFIGWGEDTTLSGGLITMMQTTQVVDGNTVLKTTNMNVYDDGTRLSVSIIDPATGNDRQRVYVTPDYDYFPFVFRDGAAHFLEDVL